MKYAPIILFAYNRLDHLQKTISCLQANDLASESDLYIVSDGYKNENDRPKVEQVRAYLHTVTGFRTVRIIERKRNIGLGRNIVSVLNYMFERHDSLIMVEDDIVSSPLFLRYMNAGLQKYRSCKNVMCVSGFTIPFDKTGVEECFFLPWFESSAWATWSDRWKQFERKPLRLIESADPKLIWHIDIEGSSPDMWTQVIDNYLGRITTWAVFFSALMCKTGGLALYTRTSMCRNIGFDGTGDNCDTSNLYAVDKLADSFDESSLPDVCCAKEQTIKQYVAFNRSRFRGDQRAYVLLKIKTVLFYLRYHLPL